MFYSKIKTLFVLMIAALTVNACGGGNISGQQVAVIVALTQTAAVLQAAPTSTNVPATPIAATTRQPTAQSATAAEAYQPLNADECTSIQTALSQNLGLTVTVQNPAPFTDAVNASGFGCQVSYGILGQTDIDTTVNDTLTSLGWAATKDGFGGVGVDGQFYNKADTVCLFTSTSGPADPNACPKGDNYVTCWGNLPADQILHTVSVNCARIVAH